MPEPFDDAAFVSRLQKLLSLLGSEQPGEADVARRKLLDHLGHHRLSLSDVGARLRPAAGVRTMFGGEDMSMERQLYLARVARQEAETDTQRARQRVAELSRSVQEANIDAARAMQGQARARVLALAGWILAAGAGALSLNLYLRHGGAIDGRTLQDSHGGGQPTYRPAGPEADDQGLRPSPGERAGTVLVQDLAVRLSPTQDGEVRAFLNRGTRVLVGRHIIVGGQTWLQVRTVSGSGWVRSGDVLH